MARVYDVISADGHLEIPPDDFLPYVAKAFRDWMPRRVQTPAGGDSWLVEGSPIIHTASNLTAGLPVTPHRSHWNADGSRFPGAGDAQQRLREQDADGLDAEVLYPPIFTLGGLKGISNPEAYLAIVEGYNTFLAEAFCPVAPDRLIANGVIPERGIDYAIRELERCARIGLRSVSLSAFPNGGSLAQPEDDRFWERALTLGMPVTAHITFGAPYPPTISGPQPGSIPDGGSLTSRQAGLRPMWTLAQLIVTGVFDRFPELQLYFAETNASWLPIAFQQLDENYKLYEHLYARKLEKMPSEYLREHVFFGFLKDRVLTKMLDLVPVENLMWGTDFPHSVTSYPHSREWLDEAFAGVAPELRRSILVETPAKFFHLDTSAELTPTPKAAHV
jgi:predicted TIM-barrel fold metal-dependent hydrolase